MSSDIRTTTPTGLLALQVRARHGYDGLVDSDPPEAAREAGAQGAVPHGVRAVVSIVVLLSTHGDC